METGRKDAMWRPLVGGKGQGGGSHPLGALMRGGVWVGPSCWQIM